jgi:predicted dehydrogenase
MNVRRIGIIMNGVTGRMGANQHLARSISAIIAQGGVRIGDDRSLMPEPILTGRNEPKLRELAETHGRAARGRPYRYTTDLAGALAGRHGEYEVFFDASATMHRARFVEMACRSDMIRAIYCEKPTATQTDQAVRLARIVRDAGRKNGVVQDKLWLPGLRKLRTLGEQGFFGRVLSVRGEFGYWVFTGLDADRPAQRPSWNYRAQDGGGIMIDMFCHWDYVIRELFGPIRSLVAHGNTDLPRRRDEAGSIYHANADDSAYAIFVLDDGVVCQFNSSWCTRVRRDDLLTLQVDGTDGSAVAGLRQVHVQPAAATPRAVWNPDIPPPIDLHAGWQRVPEHADDDNAFKAQWELFLRHVALDEPFAWDLLAGARGVQLAELGMRSWRNRTWIDVPELT